MDQQKIGALIRTLRREKHMTQKALAERLGLSDKAVSKWERGLGCPDVSLLGDLSTILGVDLARMLSGELALLASDHARKILAPRFRQGDAERAFCRRLERGEFLSIVPLYAGWHRAVEEIMAEYEALDQKNAFKRWFAFLWKNIKRSFRRNRR